MKRYFRFTRVTPHVSPLILPAFDFRRLSIERIQLVDDIWDSILEEQLERARALKLSPEQAAQLLRGEVDAVAFPDCEFSKFCHPFSLNSVAG